MIAIREKRLNRKDNQPRRQSLRNLLHHGSLEEEEEEEEQEEEEVEEKL